MDIVDGSLTPIMCLKNDSWGQKKKSFTSVSVIQYSSSSDNVEAFTLFYAFSYLQLFDAYSKRVASKGQRIDLHVIGIVVNDTRGSSLHLYSEP